MSVNSVSSYFTVVSVDKRENSDQKVCKDQRDVIYSETIGIADRVLLLLLLSVETKEDIKIW